MITTKQHYYVVIPERNEMFLLDSGFMTVPPPKFTTVQEADYFLHNDPEHGQDHTCNGCDYFLIPESTAMVWAKEILTGAATNN